MKKLLSILVLSVLCYSLHAQESPKNAVKINPLSLIFATGNVSYERAIASNQSLQLGMFYSGVSLSDIKYSGFGLTPEYRIYFAGHKEALNGVYVGPFARYQSFTLKNKSNGDQAKYSSIGGGAVIGWERAWASGFVLDLFAGPAYNNGTFKNQTGEGSFDVAGSFEGFTVRTGITLGFAF